MTTENRELFELCKQVYEATGLADTVDYFYLKNNGDYNVDRANHTQVDHNWWKLGGEVPTGCFPLYTSDYLLEKLPATVKNDFDGGNDYIILYKKEKSWYADYMGQFKRQKSDTPLKALLKLTLKLHEEEQL